MTAHKFATPIPVRPAAQFRNAQQSASQSTSPPAPSGSNPPMAPAHVSGSGPREVDAEATAARREANRKAAKDSRDKKNEEFKKARLRVADLERDNRALRNENQKMREHLLQSYPPRNHLPGMPMPAGPAADYGHADRFPLHQPSSTAMARTSTVPAAFPVTWSAMARTQSHGSVESQFSELSMLAMPATPTMPATPVMPAMASPAPLATSDMYALPPASNDMMADQTVRNWNVSSTYVIQPQQSAAAATLATNVPRSHNSELLQQYVSSIMRVDEPASNVPGAFSSPVGQVASIGMNVGAYISDSDLSAALGAASNFTRPGNATCLSEASAPMDSATMPMTNRTFVAGPAPSINRWTAYVTGSEQNSAATFMDFPYDSPLQFDIDESDNLDVDMHHENHPDYGISPWM